MFCGYNLNLSKFSFTHSELICPREYFCCSEAVATAAKNDRKAAIHDRTLVEMESSVPVEHGETNIVGNNIFYMELAVRYSSTRGEGRVCRYVATYPAYGPPYHALSICGGMTAKPQSVSTAVRRS